MLETGVVKAGKACKHLPSIKFTELPWVSSVLFLLFSLEARRESVSVSRSIDLIKENST